MPNLKNNYNHYPEIVKNKPDRSLKRLKHICPYCNSKNIKELGHSSTLVGNFRFLNSKSVKVKSMSLWDSNHHTFDLECLDCKEKFNKHVKSANVWYTDTKSVVLLGIPSCFERFDLDCSYCNGHGTIKRVYYKLDGKTPLDNNLLMYDDKGPMQIEAYKCTQCEKEEALELNRSTSTEKEEPKQIKQGFVVFEELGVTIINEYALGKIKKES